jgi:hypothetical protein
MAKARKSSKSRSKSGGKKAATGRGSKEAIEKRRVARHLNTLLAGKTSRPKLDGRTEKRRQRLITELKDGKRGKPIKPIEVVQHVDELLKMGESLSSLKRAGVKPRRTTLNDEVAETVANAQKVYGFERESWRMLGLEVDESGKVAERKRPGRRPKKKSTKKKKS